jgi:hypothetical protein
VTGDETTGRVRLSDEGTLMPRQGPRRRAVQTKLTDAEIAALDLRALAEGLTIRGGEPNRSELIRIMLAYASDMPFGWRPA